MSEDIYFKFVQALARDLNRKDIRLPSFPDVVMRIRAALDDPDTTGQDIANILGNDVVLATRMLILANSTYHNPAGIKIEGLDAAIGRVGFEKVRRAAISYAVEQLYASEELAPLKDDLRKSWADGLRLAALSEVLAIHCTKIDADSAFIAGLLNGIGTLYIFTKYEAYPELLQDPDTRQSLIDEWAAPIGESIIANWGFSEEIQATLNPDNVENSRRHVEANLVDIISVAKMSLGGEEVDLYNTAEAKRLQLTDETMPRILASYEEKLQSLALAVR